jgi:hypothetical protein
LRYDISCSHHSEIQFHHDIFVFCKDCNNSKTTDSIYATVSALQNSDYEDAIQAFERPDPEDIGRDMAFLVGNILFATSENFLSIHTTCLETF